MNKPKSLALSPDRLALVEANITYAERLARWLSRRFETHFDDMLEELLDVLMRCARSYDADRGAKFTTLFRGSCMRAARRVRHRQMTIHIPEAYFGGPMDEEGREAAGRVLELLRLYDDDGQALDQVDRNAPDPAAGVEVEEMRAQVDRLLEHLPARERIILKARARGLKQQTIGDGLGCSKAWICKVEQEAMAAFGVAN